MTEPISIKYRAFLSYSHADTKEAKGLHRRMESFRIDKGLIGRQTPIGPVPKTLRPIFRDRHDFEVGVSLNDATLAALHASAALVVLCTSAAGKSRAVNEEVRLFRWKHPERPVIPLILTGRPGWPAEECFPQALRYEIDSDGEVSAREQTVLAADIREIGDGRELAIAKVIARLIGIPPDEIYRRAERERRRKSTIRNLVVAGLALLSISTSIAAVSAWQNASSRGRMLAEAINITSRLVKQVVTLRDYTPRGLIETLLDQAQDSFDRLLAQEPGNHSLREQKGRLLIEFSQHYGRLGLSAKQADSARRAQSLFEEMVATNRENSLYKSRLFEARVEMGNAHVAQGNLQLAGFAYERARTDLLGNNLGRQAVSAVSEPLPEKETLRRSNKELADGMRMVRGVGPGPLPDEAFGQLYDEWSAAKVAIRLGDVAFEEGRLDVARTEFEKSRSALAEIRRSLKSGSFFGPARAIPTTVDAGVAHDECVASIRLADILRETGDGAKALDTYREAQEQLLRKLSSLDRETARSKVAERMFAVLSARMSLAYRQIGQLEHSLTAIRAAISSYETLLKHDSENLGYKRDLQVSLSNAGELFIRRHEFDDAGKAFDRSVLLAAELVKADDTNAIWRHDLAVSHFQIGLLSLQKGDHSIANSELSVAIRTLKDLALSDPKNEVWRLELELGERLLKQLNAANLAN